MIATKAETKPWGLTELLIQHPTFELHKLTIKAGGYCSKHFHKTKGQSLYVVSGTIRIRTFDVAGRLKEEVDLRDGEHCYVESDLRHQFHGLTDCVVYETYHGGNVDPFDIVRLSEGGCA